MSNGITILTTKLKAAALKAKSDADEWGYDTDAFHDVATPDAVIELVDALLVKEEQCANWFQMAQKLGEELDLSEKRIAHLKNDEVRQRLANAEHQLHIAELAKHNLRASRKAQFRKRKESEKQIAELKDENEYIRNRFKEVDRMFGKNLLIMQAAIIEWRTTGDAKNGLAWIFNTLFGPGELPDEDEKDAQAYFDRKYAPIDEELMALHLWFYERHRRNEQHAAESKLQIEWE
ncbi:MAG: ead/Ea22-like family protein [Enterobacteriaceae bacterium]|nr:ead/Ea22-like family protein [Enterobacteriaceae bacterium]